MDGSFIYGTMTPWVDSIRSFKDGMLKVDEDAMTQNLFDADISTNPNYPAVHPNPVAYETEFGKFVLDYVNSYM